MRRETVIIALDHRVTYLKILHRGNKKILDKLEVLSGLLRKITDELGVIQNSGTGRKNYLTRFLSCLDSDLRGTRSLANILLPYIKYDTAFTEPRKNQEIKTVTLIKESKEANNNPQLVSEVEALSKWIEDEFLQKVYKNILQASLKKIAEYLKELPNLESNKGANDFLKKYFTNVARVLSSHEFSEEALALDIINASRVNKCLKKFDPVANKKSIDKRIFSLQSRFGILSEHHGISWRLILLSAHLNQIIQLDPQYNSSFLVDSFYKINSLLNISRFDNTVQGKVERAIVIADDLIKKLDKTQNKSKTIIVKSEERNSGSTQNGNENKSQIRILIQNNIVPYELKETKSPELNQNIQRSFENLKNLIISDYWDNTSTFGICAAEGIQLMRTELINSKKDEKEMNFDNIYKKLQAIAKSRSKIKYCFFDPRIRDNRVKKIYEAFKASEDIVALSENAEYKEILKSKEETQKKLQQRIL